MVHVPSSFLFFLLIFCNNCWAGDDAANSDHPEENIPWDGVTKESLQMTDKSVIHALKDEFAQAARKIDALHEEIKALKSHIDAQFQGSEMRITREVKDAADTVTSSVSEAVAASCDKEDNISQEISPGGLFIRNETSNYSSCADIQQTSKSRSGVYSVYLSEQEFPVYCDMETDGGGWTVIQRRDDIRPHVDFNRGWEDYKTGFGDLNGEFWLGLGLIHALTNPSPVRLRVDLEDWEGRKVFIEYDTFSLGGDRDDYRLSIGPTRVGTGGDSMSQLDGVHFSTQDKDNDDWRGGSCAKVRSGGWWFTGSAGLARDLCQFSNLNGLYLRGRNEDQAMKGVVWYAWKTSNTYSLKRAEMKIRPNDW